MQGTSLKEASMVWKTVVKGILLFTLKEICTLQAATPPWVEGTL